MGKIKGLYCTDELLKRFKLLSVQNDKKMINFLESVIEFSEDLNNAECNDILHFNEKELKIIG
jgi:hypothetical protein